jgi:hypothetical protein
MENNITTPEEFLKKYGNLEATKPQEDSISPEDFVKRYSPDLAKARPNPKMPEESFMDRAADVLGNMVTSDNIADIYEMSGEIGGGLAGMQAAANLPLPPHLKVPAMGLGLAAGELWGGTTFGTAGDVVSQYLQNGEVDALELMNSAGNRALWNTLPMGLEILAKGTKALRSVRASGDDVDLNSLQQEATQLQQKAAKAGLSVEEQEKLDRASDLLELQKAFESLGMKTPDGKPLTLTKAQVTGSSLQTTMERIALSGIGSEERMKQMYETQEAALYRLFEQTKNLYGTATNEQAGKAFQESMKQGRDNLTTSFQPLFNNLDVLALGQGINTKALRHNMLQATASLASEMGSNEKKLKALHKMTSKGVKWSKIAGQVKTLELPPSAPAELKAVYKELVDVPINMSFELGFKKLRRLNDLVYDLKLTSPKVSGEINKIARTFEQSMAESAKKSGAGVYDEYKRVNKEYSALMSKIQNDTIIEFVQLVPERVGRVMHAEGNVTAVKEVYDALKTSNDLEVKNIKSSGKNKKQTTELLNLQKQQYQNSVKSLQRGYLDDLLKNVENEVSGTLQVKASSMLSKVTKPGRIKETFDAMFPEAQDRKNVYKVLRWADTLQKEGAGNFSLIVRGKQSGAASDLLNRFVQGGAVLGSSVYLGTSVSAAAGVALAMATMATPSVLAKIATKKSGVDKLLRDISSIVNKVLKGQQVDNARAMAILGEIFVRPGDEREDASLEFTSEPSYEQNNLNIPEGMFTPAPGF